jgi:hypothetical protein
VGLSSPVLYATQKQGCAVGQQHRAGIKHAVDRIWPVGGCQDRIKFMALKKLDVGIAHLNCVSNG